MDDAVYDGGHLVVAEHRSPPAELQVRGDHHRLPLVGVGEDLEEEPRAVPHRAAGRAMRPLEVVDEQRPGRYPAAHVLPHARRAGLPVAAGDRDGVLVDVYGDADAQLLAGRAALPGLPVVLGKVGLANPDGVAQHDSVLVVGYRGEHAVPPLEGRLAGDAARLGRALDGDVVAHGPDEGDPGGELLAAVLEDGARVGGEPPAAAAAAPLGTPAAVDPSLQAPRAPHSEHPGSGRQAAAASASVPTPTSSRQCLSSTASLSSRNSSAVRPATSAPKGFAVPIWICPIRPNAHPEGLSPNKDPGGRSGKFSVWPGRV